jgi:hypothetical protein
MQPGRSVSKVAAIDNQRSYRKGDAGGVKEGRPSDARRAISLCDELPPPENRASRTGSQPAHITVKRGMQISLHSTPFQQNEVFILRNAIALSRKFYGSAFYI